MQDFVIRSDTDLYDVERQNLFYKSAIGQS